jgi:hypothetical protein
MDNELLIMSKRKIRRYGIRTVAVICFSFGMQQIFAQNPSIKAVTDKTDILIGEPIQYKVTATFPTGLYKVHWFTPADSVAHFETVERGKIDTTAEGNNTVLQQTITLTSFDSGRWNTPGFVINFDPVKDDTTLNIITDSIAVNVGYAPADTSNQLRDIKPILDVEVTSYLWYYIGGAVLLLLLIAFFLWRYFKNKKKEPSTVFSGKIAPYDEAMQNLEKLKQLNLQEPEAIRKFHADLARIFKWYISRRQRMSIMNKTTGDVLVHLADNNLPKATISNTATALRSGDAVKFAKYLPPVSESEACFVNIKETIDFIHNSKPVNQSTP